MTIETKKRELWQTAHPEESLRDRILLNLDNKTKNISPENLVAITRQELVMINLLRGRHQTSEIELLKLLLLMAKLKIAKASLIKGTELEKEARRLVQQKYQQSEKGKKSQNASSRKYWAIHAADPEWRAEYNRKQRERRHREKQSNII